MCLLSQKDTDTSNGNTGWLTDVKGNQNGIPSTSKNPTYRNKRKIGLVSACKEKHAMMSMGVLYSNKQASAASRQLLWRAAHKWLQASCTAWKILSSPGWIWLVSGYKMQGSSQSLTPQESFAEKNVFCFWVHFKKLPLWTADATVQGQASTFQLWQLFGAACRHN